jgi:hypothetical protein
MNVDVLFFQVDFVGCRLLHGQGVRFDQTHKDGEHQKGSFEFGQLEGQGLAQNKNGTTRGTFKYGKVQDGIWTSRNGKQYIGGFLDGKAHGKGVETWQDGTRYEGQFVNDLRSGQGVYTFVNRDCYVGEFRNDYRHGQGTMTFFDKRKKPLSGRWAKDEFVG